HPIGPGPKLGTRDTRGARSATGTGDRIRCPSPRPGMFRPHRLRGIREPWRAVSPDPGLPGRTRPLAARRRREREPPARRMGRSPESSGSCGPGSVDLPLEEPAEPAAVLLLQLGLHPVLAGHGSATVSTAAPAPHLMVAVVGGRPVDGELL